MSCWPSWRASDYAASGREELARFAGSRVTLRTPVGIIRESALWVLGLDRHKHNWYEDFAPTSDLEVATCSNGPPHRTRAASVRGAGAPGAPEVNSARGPVGLVGRAGTEREQFDGAVREQVAGLARPAGAQIGLDR